MPTPVDHLDPLPENLLSFSVSRRAWNGVTLDVTEFRCAGRVVHQLSNDPDARLSVVVEEVGEYCEPRLREDKPCPIPYMPRHMLYAPAGMEIWGFSADTRYVKDATLMLRRRRTAQDRVSEATGVVVAGWRRGHKN